jgi:hypothetical protein
MKWKGIGKRLWRKPGTSQTYQLGLRKTTETLSQDNRCPCRCSNWALPTYVTAADTSCSVGEVDGDKTAEFSEFRPTYESIIGDRGSTVVKVLRYKSQTTFVRSQMMSLEFFIDINPSDRTVALGSTQSPTEMSTRCISWG